MNLGSKTITNDGLASLGPNLNWEVIACTQPHGLIII